MMPLYFAYGSNMDRAAMAVRCPASRLVGPARLMRHRLALTREGYATVVTDAAGCVHGLLWDLALRDVPALDRYESVGDGLYAKLYLSVVTARGPRRALVYVGRNPGVGRPRPGYIEGIVTAAGAAGLPAACLAAIHALLPQDRLVPGRVATIEPGAERGRRI